MSPRETIWERGRFRSHRAEVDDVDPESARAEVPEGEERVPRPPRRPRARIVIIVGLGFIARGVGVASLTALGRTDPTLVNAGPIDVIRRGPPMYLSAANAFVVWREGEGPLALSALDPHLGEPVRYCASSGWFEEPAHGSKYNRMGEYRLGPSPRGLDRLEVIVRGHEVYVNPKRVVEGPPRGTNTVGQNPEGPFCVDGADF